MTRHIHSIYKICVHININIIKSFRSALFFIFFVMKACKRIVQDLEGSSTPGEDTRVLPFSRLYLHAVKQ